MRQVDIIIKKRDNIELSKEEIKFMIDGYTKGDIPDYQMSAFLMAIYFNGMTDNEVFYLTESMMNSGDVLDLSQIEGIKVDKHSTGGVGDKTTLVVAPICASLGVKVAKMSGRGLGHTGGTLDKLESIPGYDINLTEEEFINQVNTINAAVMGQTKKLAPADKLLYSLRDVTGTVPSIPLIASSIMSKKLAAGADAIVLDVKVGAGAFMKTKEEALKLARLMVSIGNKFNKKMTAILTNMDEPLGMAVGNSLEVIEAINTLNGKGPKDLNELCILAAADLILEAKKAKDMDEAISLAKRQIENKEALMAFAKMVEAQKGDKSYILDINKFEMPKYTIPVEATKDGYVEKIDALAIGNAAMYLGAGRQKIEDNIDHSVGIVLSKKVGDKVNKGEALAFMYSNKENNELEYDMILKAYNIGNNKVNPKLILDIVK